VIIENDNSIVWRCLCRNGHVAYANGRSMASVVELDNENASRAILLFSVNPSQRKDALFHGDNHLGDAKKWCELEIKQLAIDLSWLK